MCTRLRWILFSAWLVPLCAFQPSSLVSFHSPKQGALSSFSHRTHFLRDPMRAGGLPLAPVRTRKRNVQWSCQAQDSPDDRLTAGLAPKALVWSAWVAYIFHIFLSDSPCGPAGGEMCGISLPVTMEAINLSINFWFVTPIVFGALAPEVHPALEGLFNIVIAWGALFVCFLQDGKGQRLPMFPFMVGTAFLTNVFYLPYLGLREAEANKSSTEMREPAKALEIAESKWWPLAMAGVFAASILWGAFARGEAYGDVSTRFSTLVDMATHTDRLAHSFVVDSSVFWLFQGWLVPDDMRRRGFDDRSAEIAARAVPFFGLVYYLLARPPLPAEE